MFHDRPTHQRQPSELNTCPDVSPTNCAGDPEKVNSIFLGIAQYIAGPLDSLLTHIEKIDLSPLGQKIGKVVGLLIESLSDNSFSETFATAIQVALEKAEFYAGKFAASFAAAVGAGLANAVPLAIETAWKASQSLGTSLKTQVSSAYANSLWNERQQLATRRAGNPNAWTPADEKKFHEVDELFTIYANKTIAGTSRANAQVNTAFADFGKTAFESAKAAMAAAGEAWKNVGGPGETAAGAKLAGLLASFQTRWENQFPAGGPGGGHGGPGGLLATERPKFDSTSFEKMGFVINAGNHAQRQVTLLEQIHAVAVEQLHAMHDKAQYTLQSLHAPL